MVEPMITVVETPTFSRQADKLFREDEKRKLIDLTPDQRRQVAALAAAIKATWRETK